MSDNTANGSIKTLLPMNYYTVTVGDHLLAGLISYYDDTGYWLAWPAGKRAIPCESKASAVAAIMRAWRQQFTAVDNDDSGC